MATKQRRLKDVSDIGKPVVTDNRVTKPFLCFYWWSDPDIIKMITIHGVNAEAAEIALHSYLNQLAGKGEWRYVVTEKVLAGLYNNETRDYVITR